MTDLPTIAAPQSRQAAPPELTQTRRRRVRRLTGRDKLVLSLMVAIPTLIEATLVWFPALDSIALSFTKWDGIRFSDIHNVGF